MRISFDIKAPLVRSFFLLFSQELARMTNNDTGASRARNKSSVEVDDSVPQYKFGDLTRATLDFSVAVLGVGIALLEWNVATGVSITRDTLDAFAQSME